jgi:hypothetical protein
LFGFDQVMNPDADRQSVWLRIPPRGYVADSLISFEHVV